MSKNQLSDMEQFNSVTVKLLLALLQHFNLQAAQNRILVAAKLLNLNAHANLNHRAVNQSLHNHHVNHVLSLNHVLNQLHALSLLLADVNLNLSLSLLSLVR